MPVHWWWSRFAILHRPSARSLVIVIELIIILFEFDASVAAASWTSSRRGEEMVKFIDLEGFTFMCAEVASVRGAGVVRPAVPPK